MEPTTISTDKKETQEMAKKNQIEEGNELIVHGHSGSEVGEHGSETQCASKDPLNYDDNVCTENLVNCKCNNTKKLNRQEMAKLSCKLGEALCNRNWELAESLVMESNVDVLNDALCMSLDFIWFLGTSEELNGLTTLIKKIVASGASNFSKATMRISFLASFVSAWQSEMMHLGGTETFVDQRLHKHLKEFSGSEIVEKEIGDKVLEFTDWAVKWIEEHHGSNNPPNIFTPSEIQLQLTAFRTFLDLAENRLTIHDFTEAFQAACFSLILYSYSLYPGWAASTSSSLLRGLLNILVTRGADNVKRCLVEASRLGCTEVVRLLIQIESWNNLPVHVDVALGVAAYYSRFDTMKFLVDKGADLISPLLIAVEDGCIPVVSWFINQGCSDRGLWYALAYAASSNQLTAAYLLPKVPRQVLGTFCTDILRKTAEIGGGSLDGVAFLLSANFLRSPKATHCAVERLLNERDESMPEFTTYLKNNWSKESFCKGVRDADDHYVNVMRVLRRGCSEIQLRELPAGMVIAIAIMPLYRECSKVTGELLSPRLTSEIVRSLNKTGCPQAQISSTKGELMTMLETQLPSFVVLK